MADKPPACKIYGVKPIKEALKAFGLVNLRFYRMKRVRIGARRLESRENIMKLERWGVLGEILFFWRGKEFKIRVKNIFE